MKENTILIIKTITNIITFIILLIKKKPSLIYKIILTLTSLINPTLLGIRYYKLEIKHNSKHLKKIYFISFFIELFLLILYYTLNKIILGLINVILILIMNIIFFYHRKKKINKPKKIVDFDLAKCISQCIQNGKLILYSGEIVFVLDKFEDKIHIRKSNGEEYVVDSVYLVDYHN
ncbi:hypothetical protein TUBRATIS_002260 [Tubulinosema ratisbonensis]|uniref:Uncharacterized protein n=1 Tax=Tubulinosema ratisbonensis TaxID=291195 RepID=A0A437APZ3_9MICR|nr:hypothetical protein TUBRATIS_002260 [Tubulinosema ratisbonensis]